MDRRREFPRLASPDALLSTAPIIAAGGVLEVEAGGYGFLRDPASEFRRSEQDVFVPQELIDRYALRPGVGVQGRAQQLRDDGAPRLVELLDVDGAAPDDYAAVKDFDRLTPIHPEARLRLETGTEPLSTRVIDLLVPIGKGQRGLIVAPPRSGKTVLLQQIGQAITTNHPDVKLMVLLVDERPEEITDMRRSIPAEVFASSLDRDVESHVRLSRMVIERAKRLAEQGQDVVVLIDSLTRMARAFNKWVRDSGRTMTGGLDIRALEIPKHLFATARALEEGGSVTILATVLVQTGSRMDDLIFEEFKGTGNMELVLDRQLADRRIWPAIDVNRSGTRREERLRDARSLHAATHLRRTLSTMHPADAMERLRAQLLRYETNREFLSIISDRVSIAA